MWRRLCTWSVLLCSLAACSDTAPEAPDPPPPQAPLRSRDSGYRSDVQAWTNFLSCWGDKTVARKTGSPRTVVSMLSRYTVLSAEAAPSEADVHESIQALEARLGLALPRSYKDFLLAYRPPAYRPHLGNGGVVLRVGLYAPAQVGRLAQLEPQLVSIFGAPFIADDADDADYYRYGVGQDGAALRSSYRRDAIVVGSHGLESHDLIVLHPQERTADGEMEAAMMMQSGQFRAPSFAELMRQLGHMEATQQLQLPPYAQAELAGGCAGRMAPHAPWWP